MSYRYFDISVDSSITSTALLSKPHWWQQDSISLLRYSFLGAHAQVNDSAEAAPAPPYHQADHTIDRRFSRL